MKYSRLYTTGKEFASAHYCSKAQILHNFWYDEDIMMSVNSGANTGFIHRAMRFFGRTGQIIFIERFITFLTRFTDVGMVYLIWKYGLHGAVYAFFGIGIIYYIFCVLIVSVVQYFLNRGSDITGLEELRSMSNEEQRRRRWLKRYVLKGGTEAEVREIRGSLVHKYESKHWFRRIVSWILGSRKTIFWIGSWFYLDPDYVTLLLYRREKSFLQNILRITLPAVLISMTVWTSVYYFAFLGYGWAVSVLNFF